MDRTTDRFADSFHEGLLRTMPQLDSLDEWATWGDVHPPDEQLQEAVRRIYNRFSDVWREGTGTRPEPLRAEAGDRSCRIVFTLEGGSGPVEASFEVDRLDPEEPDWEASVAVGARILHRNEVLPPYLLSDWPSSEALAEVHGLYRALIEEVSLEDD